MELLDYERRHIEYLEKNAGECTLFLKRNNAFPLTNPCDLVLVGSGARNTIKGGTGSGDVGSRFFKNAYEGLISRGFNITSLKWMDEYDEFKKSTIIEYVNTTKKEAKINHIFTPVFAMGYFEEEKNYDISCDYDGAACIYVLSRNSGEGNDRRNIKGDVKLSDKEVEDILYLNNKFDKFMLVLNVGGVVDLSPVLEVGNILYLSQLGVVTGDILADIILGKINPSGKLTTTWAKPEDYPYFNEFGERDNTYYMEGIYVGYRYFSTFEKETLFSFGYGLSYTDFKIDDVKINVDKCKINISCKVKNIGLYPGKEVVQVYVTKPNDEIDNPLIELVDYSKTKLLNCNEEEVISFSIDIRSFSTYDESISSYVLCKGNYYIRIGNSSDNLTLACKLVLDNKVVLLELDNKFKNDNFIDCCRELGNLDIDCEEFKLDLSDLECNKIEYKKDCFKIEELEKLSNDDLINICIGNYGSGIGAIIGQSSVHAIGGAGETTLKVKCITKSLTMADGPAGLRLKTSYGIDKKGIYDISEDPMNEKLKLFLPKIAGAFISPPKNRHGEIHHQYTTAIPIGTALAQSFNDEFISGCGDIVAEEMKMFNVDLWLAPALNIHRNILCGRNFEYYSEDPYISGRVASVITKSIQKYNGLGVVIKHFACNNQEFNRNNNSSNLSERTLREIYLKGFEYCIKTSNPLGIMTSYNLINSVHASESYNLINDILRCEWNYEGLVMTDWIQSGRSFCSKSFYPAPYAYKNILAGNDLTMPGSKKDFKNVKSALKKGLLTRDDLLFSASRIYRVINKSID